MTIDAFDQVFDKPQPRTYAVAPAGRAEVEIRAASIGTVPWKVTDANPTGECLKLRLSAGREYSFVFVDLPRDKKFLFRALAAAMGIQPDADGKVTLPDVAELVGRTASVEIEHFQTKRGETKATVKKWLPAEASSATAASTPRAAAARPRRTAAQRITAQMPDDEIPF